MNRGLLISPTNEIQFTWDWCDPSTPYPGETPYRPGDQLVDLSSLSSEEAMAYFSFFRSTDPLTRQRIVQRFSTILLPVLPPSPKGWETCLQPGYRRSCYRPLPAWYDKEITARIIANSRISAGDQADQAINEEFTHLSPKELLVRKGMLRLGQSKPDTLFPLTPMVRLIERKIRQADGAEKTVTLRQFPFHEPIAEF